MNKQEKMFYVLGASAYLTEIQVDNLMKFYELNDDEMEHASLDLAEFVTKRAKEIHNANQAAAKARKEQNS
jgi:hypothetical protein